MIMWYTGAVQESSPKKCKIRLYPSPSSSSSSQTSSFLALARAESTGWQLVITRNAFRNKTPYLRKFL